MRKRFFLSLLLTGIIFSQAGAYHADWSDCEQARKHMTRSGMAEDAKESFWGGKVTPKNSRTEFSPDDEKITWWGEFKPFESWGYMETDVRWVDPEGRVVSRAKVQGGHCRMAKASFSPRELPGRMIDGMWLVSVGCPENPIDVKQFLVRGAPAMESGVQAPSSPQRYRDIVVDNQS